MPQVALTNGELWKKTLRTSLVMVGSTALWLGVLSGAVVMTTGSASPAADSKLEKAGGAAGVPGLAGAPGSPPAPGSPGFRGPGGLDRMKSLHRPGLVTPKTDSVHPGDPI